MRLPIRVRVRALVLVAALGTLVGCSPVAEPLATPHRVLDTWPIGQPLECTPDDRCAMLVGAGLDGLARRDGAVEVMSTSLHRMGMTIDPATGDEILQARSGGPISVLVVRLVDGTERAIGVGFPGISREPVVFDWLE